VYGWKAMATNASVTPKGPGIIESGSVESYFVESCFIESCSYEG
jgi:hypothetical protein